ncbi:MAG: hypothetical protein P0119_04165 [Nitrospira sp.]|nr:hypothetical protein [Nitrospira sp.]
MVLDYQEQVKRNRTIPTVTEQDQRLQLLERDEDEGEWDEEDEGDEEGVTTEDLIPVSARPTRKAGKAATGAWMSFLEQQTQPQLLALLKELVQRYPGVRQFLQDRHNVSAGAVPKLVKALRAELAQLSAEPGWRNHPSGAGSIPDYSRVRDRLEALLAQGHADAVVEVGAQLLGDGTRQVEMSDDEGETAEEIASCLDIAFRALPQSSHLSTEQMRWAVAADLADQYELCRGAKTFWDRSHPVGAWNELAEQLAQRLAHDRWKKSQDAFSEKFQRDRLSNWLIVALERAGRREEIIPLCRQEAERTGSYLRLVEPLKKAKQWEEAEEWIRKGIIATEKPWPGIAVELRISFRGMRERQKKWDSAAALQADDFFLEPSVQTFQELEKAAQRAWVGPEVRPAALQYLGIGIRPQPSTQLWPLSESELKTTTGRRPIQPPMPDVLIEIAAVFKLVKGALLLLFVRPLGWGGGIGELGR